VLFYVVILLLGNQMLTSTLEEKENRVTEMMPCVLASSGHYLTEMLWGAKRPFGLTPQYIRPISSQRVVLAPGTCHR